MQKLLKNIKKWFIKKNVDSQKKKLENKIELRETCLLKFKKCFSFIESVITTSWSDFNTSTIEFIIGWFKIIVVSLCWGGQWWKTNSFGISKAVPIDWILSSVKKASVWIIWILEIIAIGTFMFGVLWIQIAVFLISASLSTSNKLDLLIDPSYLSLLPEKKIQSYQKKKLNDLWHQNKQKNI